MRIRITDSARKHAITDDEIRCVVEYPTTVVAFQSRTAAQGLLYLGRYDDNEPLIEVLAEHVGEAELVVFHAMYLTLSTIRLAGIEDQIAPGDITRTQRK